MIQTIGKQLMQACRLVIDFFRPYIVVSVITWIAIHIGFSMSAHSDMPPFYDVFFAALALLSFIASTAFLKTVFSRLMDTAFLIIVIGLMLSISLEKVEVIYLAGSLAGLLTGLAVLLAIPICFSAVVSCALRDTDSEDKQKREAQLHHAAQTLSAADTPETHPAIEQIHSQPRRQQAD